MQKSAHESKSTKPMTLDVQLEILDEEPEIGKFDEQDGTSRQQQKHDQKRNRNKGPQPQHIFVINNSNDIQIVATIPIQCNSKN